jgi:Fe-Mn family superoxide dismutase
MKASIKHNNSGIDKKNYNLFEDFINFLQKKFPLKNDIKITFMGDRSGKMTTGSRSVEYGLKILSKGRLNRDIMRTLAHEWVHEYQMSVLGREIGQDIGGQNEDEANAESGKLIKMFEKEYPEYDKTIFEGFKIISKKLDLISEQLLLTEKENIHNEFLMEMKKIGIDKLPYSYSALKQFVDPETMDIHYNKHYKGYVNKLNDLLSDKKGDVELEDIVKNINKYNTKVRNNAGGAFNHALFWKMLSPKKQTPKGNVVDKIIKQFGGIKEFKSQFNKIAMDSFGSGWIWLILTKNNRLKIMSTPNQDNPLMNVVEGGGYPLLGLDLWEHAYYLKYQNKRDQYINKFWNHINWEFVNGLYDSILKKKNIITENQSDKINDRIRSTVEKLGLEDALKIFGGNKDIIRRAYKDNPLSFLDQFNNLKPVIKDGRIYYVNENNIPLFYYYQDEKNGYCYINFWKIWVFFLIVFGYEYSEIQQHIKKWLGETYNLGGLTPKGYENLIDSINWKRPII